MIEDDALYRQELLTIIQGRIDEHPRSAQAKIGPSGAGDCERKIAWSLAYGGQSDRPGGWAAAKGTVLHAWLDDIFKASELTMPDGSARFMSDMKLDPVDDLIEGGTLDLYDRIRQCVIDWKLPGDYSMKAVRGGSVNETYAAQIQLYGLGLERMGYPVSRVAIMWLPMGTDELHGTTRGAVFRSWPYDRQAALDTIANVRRVASLVELMGPQRTMEYLPKRSSFCNTCPAWIGSGDRRAVCEGADAARPSSHPFAR